MRRETWRADSNAELIFKIQFLSAHFVFECSTPLSCRAFFHNMYARNETSRSHSLHTRRSAAQSIKHGEPQTVLALRLLNDNVSQSGNFSLAQL